MLKKIFAISAVTVASVTTLAACSGGTSNGGGDSQDTAKFVGEWKCKSFETGGEDMGSMFEALGLKLEDSVTMSIQDNGNYTVKMNAMGEEETTQGTWKVSGNDTIVMKESDNGSEVTGKLEGGELHVEEDDSKMVLIK